MFFKVKHIDILVIVKIIRALMLRSCEKMTVTVPKITCEDETTELCQVK